MSTIHQLGSVVESVRKRTGKKSTNSKKATEDFGGSYEKDMPTPLCIENNNRHMGRVDIADLLRSLNDPQLTSFRTWLLMLFRAYDTMITNTCIFFKDMPQSPDTITHKEFRLQCAWGLILAGAGQVATPQASQSTNTKSVNSNFKEALRYPWAEATIVGTSPLI